MEIVNLDNKLLEGVKLGFDKALQEGTSGLAKGSIEKATITVKLELLADKNDDGNVFPKGQYNIKVQNTDNAEKCETEKTENINKQEIKGKITGQAVELIIGEDGNTYTEEAKTPLEKMADKKTEEGKE